MRGGGAGLALPRVFPFPGVSESLRPPCRPRWHGHPLKGLVQVWASPPFPDPPQHSQGGLELSGRLDQRWYQHPVVTFPVVTCPDCRLQPEWAYMMADALFSPEVACQSHAGSPPAASGFLVQGPGIAWLAPCSDTSSRIPLCPCQGQVHITRDHAQNMMRVASHQWVCPTQPRMATSSQGPDGDIPLPARSSQHRCALENLKRQSYGERSCPSSSLGAPLLCMSTQLTFTELGLHLGVDFDFAKCFQGSFVL